MPSPLQKLQSLLSERPFRPFFLKLDRGEHVVVSHPNMVELHVEGQSAAVLRVIDGPVRLSTKLDAINLAGLLGADEEFDSDLILFSKYPLPLPRVQSAWSNIQRWICIGLIIVGVLVIGVSLLASIDDGQGPISEVIRIRRVAAIVVLVAGIVMAVATAGLHHLNRQTFRSYDS